MAVAVAAAAALLAMKSGDKQVMTYEMTEVSRGDISMYVTATGTIEPVTEAGFRHH